MNTEITEYVELSLKAAAALQLAIAVLNLFLVPLLKWKEDLARVPLLLREVFQVHAWFISVTLAIFGVLTWRFAADIAGRVAPLDRWLAAGIGLFWGLRTVLQVGYYSSTHWRGKPGRTLVHVALLFLYGGLAAVYLWTALAPVNVGEKERGAGLQSSGVYAASR
ncbi:conserved membrane hypothetical protein [Verrucomicrobia bacterium]|nr:conserved membrane hypothetical protein [Verrucomicrobiota bacterium]